MVLCSLGLENESSERQRIRSPDQAGRDHKRVRLQSAVPSPRPITDEASASQRVTPPGRKPVEGGGRAASYCVVGKPHRTGLRKRGSSSEHKQVAVAAPNPSRGHDASAANIVGIEKQADAVRPAVRVTHPPSCPTASSAAKCCRRRLFYATCGGKLSGRALQQASCSRQAVISAQCPPQP